MNELNQVFFLFFLSGCRRRGNYYTFGGIKKAPY